jgi:2-polyprenyl-3-methyl-5-hydroxy-6-metoxy-1,4-benzoquinol methylase
MPQERSTDVAFDPRAYWEERLSESCDLRGVGYARKGQALNRWMYRHKAWQLAWALERLGINPCGYRVLDIGSGSGFYINFWKHRGADVMASDLTETSVNHLRRMYPNTPSVRLDISAPFETSKLGTYDIVSVLGVMYHIVDDQAFTRTLQNIRALLKPGGWLLVTDIFMDTTVVSRDNYASRSRPIYASALAELGFNEPSFLPVFATLNAPSSIQNPALRFAATVAWEIVTAPLAIPVLNNLLGFGLALVDRCVVPRMSRGPSISLLAARLMR